MIELQGVSKIFLEGRRERVVFRDTDLSVAAGQTIAILGRSGSGKSTLLNLIGGMDEPTAGDVVVEGTEINKMSETRRTIFRRDHIGFVFQFFNLISTLTVEENLRLPLELAGRPGARERERIRWLLDEVGLVDRADSFPDRLSGGEQQRVAIARALVNDPPLLLADEPTGNLDLSTGRDVIELLERLVVGGRKTLLLVTHSHDVASIADRVLSIRDGRLIERGLDGPGFIGSP